MAGDDVEGAGHVALGRVTSAGDRLHVGMSLSSGQLRKIAGRWRACHDLEPLLSLGGSTTKLPRTWGRMTWSMVLSMSSRCPVVVGGGSPARRADEVETDVTGDVDNRR